MQGSNEPGDQGKRPLTAQEQYNIVTDLGTGLNCRWRDNLFQGLAILAFILIGALVGWWLAGWEGPGLLGGALLGLIGGWLISGIALMIYRTVRHAQGKHD
jgi:uncharacterized membrane protein YfcA